MPMPATPVAPQYCDDLAICYDHIGARRWYTTAMSRRELAFAWGKRDMPAAVLRVRLDRGVLLLLSNNNGNYDNNNKNNNNVQI